jgi:hypothetical protein
MLAGCHATVVHVAPCLHKLRERPIIPTRCGLRLHHAALRPAEAKPIRDTFWLRAPIIDASTNACESTPAPRPRMIASASRDASNQKLNLGDAARAAAVSVVPLYGAHSHTRCRSSASALSSIIKRARRS